MLKDDWRLANQMNYLYKKRVRRAEFKAFNECDHRHCAFCWQKFSEQERDQHAGFQTIEGPWWICEQCFLDFYPMFKWRITNT